MNATSKEPMEDLPAIGPMLRGKVHAINRPSRVWGIGSLPDHWLEKPLKHVVQINSDKLADCTDTDFELEYVDIGNVTLTEGITSTEHLRFEDAPSRARRLVREGDTIVSTVRTYLKAVAHIVSPPPNLVVSTGFAVLRATPSIHGPFLYRLAQSEAFVQAIVAHSVGVSYPAINASDIGRFLIPVPPLPEQRAIAAFLDRETARIDALIAKKQRLIELLQEKRSALISQLAATDAGVPTVRLGYYVSLLPGFAFPSNGFSDDPDDVRLMRGANLAPGHIVWEDSVRWPRQDAGTFHEYTLRPGDIVFGMDRPWISGGVRVARVAWSDVPSLLLQRVARLRARNGLSQDYLEILLRSPQFQGYFEPILTGVSVPHISPDQIRSFRLCLPSVDEQRQVVDTFAAQSKHINHAIGIAEFGIDRLREYRSALISAAVTGKIDVREECG